MCSTRGGLHYGLQRCWGPVSSSKMAVAVVLDCTQNLNYETTSEIEICDDRHEEYDIL